MCDQPNPLTCIGWDFHFHRDVAICEHPGCPWESNATTVTAQTSAYINHHNHRHQEDGALVADLPATGKTITRTFHDQEPT